MACPHFIENWVYFNNPVYPLMMGIFTHSTPTMPDAPEMVRSTLADRRWHATADLSDRIQRRRSSPRCSHFSRTTSFY